MPGKARRSIGVCREMDLCPACRLGVLVHGQPQPWLHWCPSCRSTQICKLGTRLQQTEAPGTGVVYRGRPWPATGMTTAKWLQIEPSWLPLEKIVYTQQQLSLEALLAVADGAPSWTGDPYPNVVRWRGLYWLEDGHHRVVVAAIQGAAEVRVRILDLDV